MKFFGSYKHKSDKDLMMLIQKGNHKAFSVIYDKYAPRMKSFFYRMLWSDNKIAEDFVHDLFTKLIERPEKYNTEKPFLPWLFQVASNMCKNAYRKRKFEIEYLNQIEKNKVQIPVVDQKIDNQLLTDRLHILLNRFEEDKKKLFLLKYQQQLSTKELAEVFDTNEGTIKSRLHYIRKELIVSLEEDKNYLEL